LVRRTYLYCEHAVNVGIATRPRLAGPADVLDDAAVEATALLVTVAMLLICGLRLWGLNDAG
jgi:hypothetical protein